MEADQGAFDEHLAAWREYTASPWGRLRYAVVAHTLGRVLPVGPPALRVLDVGGGDGTDALALARAGHRVTVLDTSGPMLDVARAAAAEQGLADMVTTRQGSLDDIAVWARGGFDVVLCHFLLQYRPDTKADVRLLARALAPGGLLSLIAPNPAGLVLSAAVRRGPRAAEQELMRDVAHTVMFERDVRKISHEAARAALSEEGLRVEGQYGGRCINDLITDDAVKWEPDYYQALERLEIRLSDREPYNLVGQFWHLVARLPG